MLPMQPEKRIVTAETTRQYREASLRYVSPDDTVLEVGCHEGVTTAMLHGSIVGVDMSQITIDMARSKYPQVRFEAVDGANIEALKCLSQTGEYDRVRNHGDEPNLWLASSLSVLKALLLPFPHHRSCLILVG